MIQGAVDYVYQLYGESLTPHIADTGSRLLNFFIKKTLCICDTESQ
jgi:hypothetical protein